MIIRAKFGGFVRASLGEPERAGTVLRSCVCISTYTCLRPFFPLLMQKSAQDTRTVSNKFNVINVYVK